MPKQRDDGVFKSCALEATREGLMGTLARFTARTERYETPIPGLVFFRRSAPSEPASVLYDPCVCVITQGAKRVILGDEAYVYDPKHFLITSVNLPTVAHVIKATPAKPCLGLVLRLDPQELARLLVDSKLPPPREQGTRRAMATGEMTLPLLTAFQRLAELLDEPRDIPVLAPIIRQEILYRLLVSDQGARLRQIAAAGSQGSQVAQAIGWLKDNYSKPLSVEELAAKAYMSQSTFHHHFRALTAMSPLQYQKWLRLNEARRLMLAEKFDAATAAMEVGYESPSQFSREYSRQFGAPPLRDIKTLSAQPVSAP